MHFEDRSQAQAPAPIVERLNVNSLEGIRRVEDALRSLGDFDGRNGKFSF